MIVQTEVKRQQLQSIDLMNASDMLILDKPDDDTEQNETEQAKKPGYFTGQYKKKNYI